MRLTQFPEKDTRSDSGSRSPERLYPTVEDDSSIRGIVEYYRILCRRKGALILITVLGGLTALLLTLPQTPIYQASTSLEIQGINANFLGMKDVDPTSAGSHSAESYIRTQIQILRSKSLVDRVIATLRLAETPTTDEQTGRVASWRRALGLPANPQLPTHLRLRNSAQANLRVRTSFQDRVIEVLYDSPDPNLAALFVNTLSEEFARQNLESRWQTSQHTSAWLTRQLDDLKITLEKSEDELQRYASATGLIFTAERESLAEEKLRQLQQALSEAQASRVGKQSQYEIGISSLPESLPDVLDHAPLREYQVKLAALRQELAELSTLFKPTYYRVQRVQAQIDELTATLAAERGNVMDRIRNEYESEKRREKLLAIAYANQAQLVSDQAAKAIHYKILKREVDSRRQLYESMLRKMNEAGIASAMNAATIRVIDPAEPPPKPYKPDLPRNVLFGLLAGFVVAALIVTVRERADSTLRAPGETPSWLRVPELGLVPARRADPEQRRSAKNLPVKRKVGRERTSAMGNGRRGSDRSENRLELVTWQRQHSLLAESFEAIATSLLLTNQDGEPARVVVVASASPTEGKTTMVANLGVALAGRGRRVVLVDADMRQPRLHEVFQVENHWGLSIVLHHGDGVSELDGDRLACRTAIPGLDLLPSGPRSPNVACLLSSLRASELFGRLRGCYDVVLVDTPPVLQVSDARLLGRLADGVVLVVRAGKTLREAVRSAQERFNQDGTPVLGTVLNNWEPRAANSRYYNIYYREFYDRAQG